jgi:hypothetical protein
MLRGGLVTTQQLSIVRSVQKSRRRDMSEAARRWQAKGGRMRWLLSIAVVAVTGAAANAQNATHQGDPLAGRPLALRHCDSGHIVAANQEIQPLVSGYAPSFFDVANKPGVTPQALEKFRSQSHPYAKMPYPQLSAAQVGDLISYILTLRGEH